MNEGSPIADNRMFEVVPDQEVEAEKMLDSTSIQQVDVETAHRLAGERFLSKGGYLPFLVRGLYFSKRTGRWTIYETGEKLQIAHHCMGNRNLEMRRQALVILLKSRPAKIYVFCSATE